MNNQYCIGIDLGGTNFRAALVARDGRIIRKVRKSSSAGVIETLTESVGELFDADVPGIGLGVAGLIDRAKGRVFASPNLQGIVGADLVDLLSRRFNVPVFIENDANAAALGEKICGAGRDFDNFVLLTLGTGIGGGIIHKGELLDVAAEVGHMSISYDGERCQCGNVGCLENYASARAMVSRAVKMLEKGHESMLKGCCKGSFYKLTPEDIYKAALEGDTLSREVLRDAGRALGVGIASLINIMSPQAVILTGGLIGAWNIYVEEAMKEASKRAFKDLSDSVRIMPSSLGDDAGVIGAASVAFRGLCRASEQK